MPTHYDYIITGAGCAGMSLLMRMMQHSFFDDKQILVIDRSQKTNNDRTWCFWEKEAGIFDSIVTHSWRRAAFYSADFSTILDLDPYEYKMIQGLDLYTLVKQRASQRKNIAWKYSDVRSVYTSKDQAVVETADEILTAAWVFNSILFDPIATAPKQHYLLQHFTGWVIETYADHFDPSAATYMDFRMDQEIGTNFMYVLPVSTSRALVEYTLFTQDLLTPEAYEMALQQYIHNRLGIANYNIVHKENGVIPMTNYRFPLQKEKIVFMGTAGGQVKGSSGYAFSFIQKRTKSIIDTIVAGKYRFDVRTLSDRKFHLYDSVLLNVLRHNKMKGEKIFAAMFSKNPPDRVLRFLDNGTNLTEDVQIMKSVPSSIFLPAAFYELFQTALPDK